MIRGTEKNQGFTIVELLIVIVIIAILASITIVAFNGIVDRANTTQTTTAVGNYAKGLIRYAVDNASYPTSSVVCLGTATVCGNITPPNSAVCFGLGGVSGTNSAATTFKSTMSPYFGSNYPNPSTAGYPCSTGSYAGAFYYSADGITAYIYSFFKASGTCPAIGGLTLSTTTTTGNTLYCRYLLPAIS